MADELVTVEVGPFAPTLLQKEQVAELARREGTSVVELLSRMLSKHQPGVAAAYYSGGMEAGEQAATEAWNAVMEEVFRLVRPQ